MRVIDRPDLRTFAVGVSDKLQTIFQYRHLLFDNIMFKIDESGNQSAGRIDKLGK